jgi:hypothetical protein
MSAPLAAFFLFFAGLGSLLGAFICAYLKTSNFTWLVPDFTKHRQAIWEELRNGP